MSTRLRICYIGWADYPHLLRWAKWFAARGHDVHVFSNHPVSVQNVSMHDIRPAPSGLPRLNRYLRGEVNIGAAYWLRTVLRVRSLVREIRPDILHSHSLYYPGYMGALTGFQLYVVTAWSYDDATLGYAPHAVTRPLRRLFARCALGRARLITGISNDLVREMVRAGAPNDRTIRFNWGVDLQRFNLARSRANARRSLGLPEDAPVVLSVRNLGDPCNVEALVRAIPDVLRRAPRTHFVFTWNYAQPDRLQWVQDRVREYGAQESVRLVGRVPHEELPVYYQAADVFVSLATWDSGPISMVEAMACGAVPVMGALPSVREWITDGENGYLVSQTNAAQVAGTIVNVLEHPKKHQEIACANWRIIQERADFNERMLFLEQRYLGLVQTGKET